MNAFMKEEKIQLVKTFEAKRTGQQRDNQNKKGKITVNCKYCGLSHERDKEKCPAWGNIKLADHVGKRIVMLKYALAEATVIVDKHIPSRKEIYILEPSQKKLKLTLLKAARRNGM